MRSFSAPTLLVAGVFGLIVSNARGYGNGPCGPTPCPAESVPCPPQKVVVELSPPEVVFQQAPPVLVHPVKPGLFNRLHHKPSHYLQPTPVVLSPLAAPQAGAPAFVATAAAPTALVSMPVQSASVVPVQASSFVAVPQLAAPIAPQFVLPAAPQVAAPQFTVAAVAPLSVAQFQAVPVVPQAFATAPTPCQSSSSFAANPLASLAALKASQEAEVRAAAAALERARESLAVLQQAAQTLRNGDAASAQAQDASGQELARQVADIRKRVERLEKIVVDHEDRLIKLEKP